MFPYFAILTIIIVLAYVIQNTRSRLIYNFCFASIYLILVLFAGLRNYSVGTDTGSYVSAYMGATSFFDFYSDDVPSTFEVGYLVIQEISKFFSRKYFILLLIVSSFISYFYVKAIKDLSSLPFISFFVFITFGIYSFTFNGMRQAIAAAIFLYAIRYIIEGDFKKYTIWIIFGFFFHKTIIIALPLYFLFKRRFTLNLFFVLLLASVLSSIFFNQIVDFGVIISKKYKTYLETEQVGGRLLTIFYAVMSVSLISIRYSIKPSYLKEYDIYLNMFLIATMIYLIVFFSGAYIEFTRLGFYFLSSSIFIWPLIFKSVNRHNLPFLMLFFIFIHLTFYYILLSKMSGLIPYKLNTELFSNF